MDIDTTAAVRVDISPYVGTLVDDDRALARLARLVGEHGPEQTGPDHQIIELLAGLDQPPVLLRLLRVGIDLVLALQIRVADRLRVPLHDHVAMVEPDDMIA